MNADNATPQTRVAIATPVATGCSSRRCATNASIVRPLGSSVILARSFSGRRDGGIRRLSINYQLTVLVHGQGLYDVTHKVAETVVRSAVTEGLATVFIRHTSASLVIQENAEGTARQDLERWFNRLVPELDRSTTVEGRTTCPRTSKPR